MTGIGATLILAAAALVLIAGIAMLVRAALVAARAEKAPAATDARRQLLEEEKERALLSIRDLELDYSLRKVDDTDYQKMRQIHEARALAAMKAIQAMDANQNISPSPKAAAGAKLTQVLLCVVGAACGSAACLKPSAAAEGESPSPAHHAQSVIQVRALRLDSTGALMPLANAIVAITTEQPETGLGGGPSPVVLARTDAMGEARTVRPEGDPRSALQASVLYQNQLFGAAITDNKAVIIAYEVTQALEALSFRSQARVFVDEGVLGVQTDVVLINRSSEAIEVGYHNDPLVIPVVAPAIQGRVLTRGWLPPQAAKNLNSTVDPPRGRIELWQGAWAYRGLILPGEGTRLRLAYTLSVPDDRADLGFGADGAVVEDAVVAVEWGSRVAPQVNAAGDAWGSQLDQGMESVQVLRWVQRLERGESAIFRLDGLPREGQVRRKVAMSGAAGMLFLLALGLLRARHQGSHG